MKKYILSISVGLFFTVSFVSAQTSVFVTDLTIGSFGSDVISLQTWLIGHGFDIPAISSGISNKGFFGSQTKLAVIRYQQSVGLPKTGYVGPLTRNILNSQRSSNATSTISNRPAEIPTSMCPLGYVCRPIQPVVQQPLVNVATCPVGNACNPVQSQQPIITQPLPIQTPVNILPNVTNENETKQVVAVGPSPYPIGREVRVSATTTTDNVLLGNFTLKSEGTDSTLKGIRFTINDTGGLSASDILANISLKVGDMFYHTDSAGLGETFSNLNIPLPKDSIVPLTFIGQVNADISGHIWHSTVTISLVANSSNIIAVDSSGSSMPIKGTIIWGDYIIFRP